jgi:methionyl-tRNA synthetase
MTAPARILVTSALPYANGPVHLGHLAGCYLPSDIYVRYQRLMGRDVIHICGSDEHGVPIILRARAENVSPQEIVDRYHALMRDAFAAFGVSFDHYDRTSAPLHHQTSQDFFRAMEQKKAFVHKTEQQLYDPEAKMFLADRFVGGTCPSCGNPNAYGDQCEKCGRALSPKELIDPRSRITNSKPELRDTTHWYLPLGHMQAWLTEWLGTHEDWKPNVLGQAKSWLNEGLADRSMTRDQSWGIAVPEDVAKAAGVDATGKVLYVWFDAPIGYISSTRQWAIDQGEPDRWKKYWQSEDTKLVHFIGKDNIVFHTLIFPSMLKLHGGYVLPENVPANEFLNLEGEKLSTSRNWAVWVHEILEVVPPDYLRYAILSVLPETKDSDFSFKDMQARINNELADTFGNFVNRSLKFAVQYLGGVVPPLGELNDADKQMLQALADYPKRIGDLIESYRFRDAGAAMMSLARDANKYFNDAAPWATRKSDPPRCDTTIHVALQVSAALAIVCEPFLPFSAKKLRDMLGIEGIRSSERADVTDTRPGWYAAAKPLLKAGQKLGEPQILFSKLEDSLIEDQLAKLNAKKATLASAQSPAPAQGQAPASSALPARELAPVDPSLPYQPIGEVITYDDFAKLDLRVAKVVACERIEKSKKLLKCQVDLGLEQRQVLAGVGEHLAPEDLLGKHVVMVSNLAPRKMMGLESQGMLLMAKDRTGRLIPVFTQGEPGSTVA